MSQHSDFVDLLALHAPYVRDPYRIQCNACLDTRDGGVYDTTAHWAEHVRSAIIRAGFTIKRRT